MKKQGKILTLLAALVACLALTVGLTACNSGESVEIQDVYTAKGTIVEMGTEYDLKMTSATSLTLYTDGSYALIVSSYGFMGAYGNSQVQQATSLSYGTYTLELDAEDEELGTLKLSAPTRIITNNSTTSMTPVYYDTADESTFTDSDTTAADYLSENGKAYTLTVNPQTKTISSGL